MEFIILLAQSSEPLGILDRIPGGKFTLIGAGVGIVILFLLTLMMRGGKKQPSAPTLGEDLSSYLPAPAGPHRVSVMNQPARIRLVVVAPAGKQELGDVPDVCEQVMRGLGKAVKADRARQKVWPPQLSNKGFAPTFYRETKSPDREGKPSHWVLVAGVARAGGKPVLVGLALYTDEPSTLGRLTIEDAEWGKVLQVER
jgi:hypothetical protein